MNASVPALQAQSHERTALAPNGWLMLFVVLLAFADTALLFVHGVRTRAGLEIALGVVAFVVTVILCGGFFTLQPNEAAVLILFGAYQGTVRNSGFFFTNPFNKKIKISLRARNLNGEKLKVNEKRGNPIEIAAVVVWRISDTAQAIFDVDRYENYV